MVGCGVGAQREAFSGLPSHSDGQRSFLRGGLAGGDAETPHELLHVRAGELAPVSFAGVPLLPSRIETRRLSREPDSTVLQVREPSRGHLYLPGRDSALLM